MKTALGIWERGQWRDGGLFTGHARALKMVEDAHAPLLQRGDRAGTKFYFDEPYRVIVPDRDLWSSSNRLLSPEGPTWFTDSSVTATGSGAGITSIRLSLWGRTVPLCRLSYLRFLHAH